MTTSEPGSAVAGSVGTPDHFFSDPLGHEPVRAELFGLDRLEAHARQLAAHVRRAPVVAGRPLLRRFMHNRRCLLTAHREISAAYRRQERFGPDAEWLLDNFHIVTEALIEIRTDLPRGYYQLLPKIKGGPLDGLPRVYAVALELVAHCDSCLDEGHITRFVEAFQTITPLTIGELWAIPIMLRLVVVDNLRRLAAQILLRPRRPERGGDVGGALPGRRRRGAVPPRGEPGWSDSFIVQLLDWMHERGAAVAPGVEWLENHLCGCDLTTHAVLARERQRQAANQVSIGNCVTTLRVLSALDWAAFFERTSRVEAELRQDPAGVYARQDFPTRDRYRREVEKLSRGSRYDELEVARQAVGMAARRADSEPPANHVGYYLIDEGRTELERLLRYRSKPRDAFRTFVLNRPRLVYFGGLAVVVAVAVGALASYAAASASGTVAVVLAVAAVLAALPPAGDIAVSLVNSWLTSFLPPRVLPKLRFKEGIPADCATFVVMPTLLARPQSAAGLLEQLEIHYLANPDPRLRFALLTDFADAPAEHMPEDDAIVRAALDGVRALNERYADGGPDASSSSTAAAWNPAQGCWMGWERKRGKLSEFNRLLRGARDTSYTVRAATVDRLPRIRYVITLDADTQLPHDAARRLVGTLAHPLNRPRFDPAQRPRRRGYGVLQPRVSFHLTRPPRRGSPAFSAARPGIDPYTTAVSDIYQDLFGAAPSPARASTTWTPSRRPPAAPSPKTTSSATT